MGRRLLAASTFCVVTGNPGFAQPPDRPAYVLMDMYSPTSSRYPRHMLHEFGNEIMYDVGGLLRHLFAEVLPEEGREPGRTARVDSYYGTDEVTVWHLRVLNPPAAVSRQHHWEFAPYIHFENAVVANATDEGLHAEEALSRLSEFGDQVGVQAFRPGLRDPRFEWDGSYYSFSISGPCPNFEENEKYVAMFSEPSMCLRHSSAKRSTAHDEQPSVILQGTQCKVQGAEANLDASLPDGTTGCVIVIEGADIVSLDTLAGIDQQDCGGRSCKTWHDFHVNCTDSSLQFTHNGSSYCREYDVVDECKNSCANARCQAGGDVGLMFWQGHCDAMRNLDRLEAIISHTGDATRLMKQYERSPLCSRYEGCTEPRAEEGTGYCHRDSSGVCGPCFVPGTKQPASKSSLLGQSHCRWDLFKGRLPQYQNDTPSCSSACGGRCSLASDEDACCVFIGNCSPDWKVGPWSVCSSTCGAGTRTRKVQCPFSEAVGPCDESKKPAESEVCRGTKCQWIEDREMWSLCSNPCGLGVQFPRLSCASDQADDCISTQKPRQTSRACVGLSTKQEFCRQCSDGSTCSRCLDGFELRNGQCVNRHAFIKVSYLVQTNLGMLAQRHEFLAALAQAFGKALPQAVRYLDLGDGRCLSNGVEPRYEHHEAQGYRCSQLCSANEACHGYSSTVHCLLFMQRGLSGGGPQWGGAHCFIKQQEISAQVMSLSLVEEEENIGIGSALITAAVNLSQSHGSYDEEEDHSQTVANLERMKHQLTEVDLQDFPQRITDELRSGHDRIHQITTAALGTAEHQKPEAFCSDLRRWQEKDSSCSPPPSFLVKPTSTLPVPMARHNDTSRRTMASGPSTWVDGVVQDFVDEDDYFDHHGGQSGHRHHFTSWLVAGSSLGAATATGLAIVVGLLRRRQGELQLSSENSQLFKGLAGTSSW